MAIPHRLEEALAGRYTLEREIGAGGMATVYLADDLKHRRKVAVKVLRAEFAQSLGHERFIREIEIAASLTHPHILPLHDSGEAAGFLYFVMPFIEGESLRDRIDREGRLPVHETVRLFHEVAEALGEAHARGVVHRDMKPENILLSSGHALVVDFGIAKGVAEATAQQGLTAAGVTLGTPQYMAPEQAIADPDVDHRADLFALGSIAYELLTGEAAFAASNARAALTAVITRTPPAPHSVRPAVPEALSELVMQCLEKEADDRPQSAGEVLSRLDAIMTPTPGVTAHLGLLSTPRRSRWFAAAAVAVVIAGFTGAWRWNADRTLERWARAEAIPEVLQLLGDNRIAEAAQLALEADAILGSDPVLEPHWPRMTSPYRIVTDPPGAEVVYRPYDSDDEWRELGLTPIESERFPVGAYRFQIRAEGYETVDQVRSLIPANQVTELANAALDYLEDASYAIDITLSPEGSLPEGMLSVSGGLYGTVPIIGFGVVQPVVIPQYLIQRTEVTIGAYQEFVDAGGYEDESLWTEPFMRQGEVVPWAAAMAEFRDATGRPGPATWALSQPPQDSETLPVGGVSWFEAVAYCQWQGWQLPTLYHWARAALPSSDVWIPFNPLLTRASNFNGVGPEPVASRNAMGVSGAQDLGGNVREWVATSSGDRRYLVGGGWSDPIYWIHDSYPADPWRREPVNGFRCASYPVNELPPQLLAPLDVPVQDFTRNSPLPDAAFDTRLAFYAYDQNAPLSAEVTSSAILPWGATQEWVTIETAYGERMPVRLHIPTDHEPPFEAIVFFGGGNVVRSSEMEEPQPPLDALVRSGRVLVEPAYDGTFQRNNGRTLQRMGGQGRQELVGNWIKDLGRVLDYLMEREDIDHTRVSYLGLSLGSALAPNLLPFESRFRAAILYSGGFSASESQASIDDRTGLLERVSTPVLMLGGQSDFNSPIDPHQEAFFRAFGTADDDKRFRVYDSGHWPLPMNEVIRETVDFLDRHAGPR